jgi:hypothetical protein
MQAINSSFNHLTLGTGSNVSGSSVHAKKSANVRVNPIDNPLVEKKVVSPPRVTQQNKAEQAEQVQQVVDSQKQTQPKQAEQSQHNKSQNKQSFALAADTLAFLEGNQAQNQLVHQQSTAAVSGSNEFIAKDHISRQNKTAVSSYQHIDNLAQRESVQKLLGVDLYA